ncbi:RagB/SusD family nutrient uptake outer membrane protein [Algibacter sp.]|nr:RagB/SusD family nutrient uptake outer membrane protein [Algibacter sp.]MDB4225657.1 RagB/SusD family nutrient uptake outer membrane protein [bacterium]MDA9070344.1 RagB/SusD family nutrient uptake outer membrane protein [Algibacter sp.]MDA9344139.1 RagB/SusD family nutrient uptake outer membrane protein [Algibacter sp.]MDC1226153.1 RagB/SusD family nutrient uptake outer membrane protein [Algibacter sp.]MDC1276736.1 RagB/SusD family nutrient uptake outer membrane protein [Algibacter sp.]
MKNTNKIIALLITITVFFNSCDDQLVDVPQNAFSEIQVFSTEEGVETAVNGMYAQLQGYDYYGARMRLLLWPHSGKYQSKQGANNDVNKLDATNTNINLDKLWRGMWQTINQINLVIINVEGNGLDNETTSLGQAHFLRAVVYFDLVRMFEEVPIRLVPTTKDDIHIAKSTKEQLYNLIIEDLKKATELLPDRGEYIDGRPLKYAANAYLAKVYITLAGRNNAPTNFPDFNAVTESEITTANITDFWGEAKTELDYVINNGGYSLVSTFNDLWKQDNRNTSESIFELQYGHTGAVRTNDIMRDVTPAAHPIIALGTTSFGRIRPNKEMFSDHIIQYSGIDYTGVDFIPAGNAAALINLDEALADPRINETFIFNSYARTNNGNNVNLFPRVNKGNNAYAHLKKYKDLTYDGTTTINNHIMLRYADILLLRAEVENEINGPSTAYTYVNEVLLRARTTSTGITTQPADWSATSVPTQNDFRERIMKEREYELNGEGHEWFDMRRRGLERFQEQIDHHNAAVTFYKSENNKDFIFSNIETEVKFPIPLAELSGNNLINE